MRILPLLLPLITACAPVGSPAVTIQAPSDSNVARPFGHVLVLVEENNDYLGVIGNPSLPYINALANQYGLATQFYANTHPSIGNYFMLVTGQIVTNDDYFEGTITDDNLVRRLVAAHKTWKAYVEDLPPVGFLGLGDRSGYASKHNPFVYLSDVRDDSSQVKNVVPFSQLGVDLANDKLPNFGFIVPNLCNDAHDCSLAIADSWLKTNVEPLVANPTFRKDGLLIVTFDEAEGDDASGGGRIPWVAISPARSKSGYKSTTFYQHESTLRLIQQALGLDGYLGGAASAPDMGEFFVNR